MPGTPKTANQKRGAMTPSLRFSANVSRAAVRTSCADNSDVSRPTIRATCALPSSRLRSRAVNTSRTSRIKVVPARQKNITMVSKQCENQPSAIDNEWSHHVSTKTNAMRKIAISAPFSWRCAPRLSRCSPKAIILPNHTTGCGRRWGSPNTRSKTQPRSSEKGLVI